jgi:hypothetical protein
VTTRRSTDLGTYKERVLRREDLLDRAGVAWPVVNWISDNEQKVTGRIGGGWAYEMLLRRQNGRPVVQELRVFPASLDLLMEPLLSQVKANVRFGHADRAAERARLLARLALHRPQNAIPVAPPGGLTARDLRRIPFGARSGTTEVNVMDRVTREIGRVVEAQGRGDVRLASIAAQYVRVLSSGSRKSNVDVAQRLGLSVSRVRDAVCQARRRGLLSPTCKRGVPGGELAPRAVELLRVAAETRGALQAGGNASGSPCQTRRKGEGYGRKNRG